MITLHDFQAKGYEVPMPATVETVAGTHHKQQSGQTFGSAQGSLKYPPVVYNLTLDPAGNDTIFLPYYQDAAASVRIPNIPAGPSFFVTSNLSGCAIYICKNANDELIIIHANSQTGSDKATMEAHAPSFQSRTAASELDTYALNARGGHGQAPRTVALLTKTAYLRCLDGLSATGAGYLAGTTVAGWRQPGTYNWSFHYQVWGKIGSGAVQLFTCKEFYRNY